MIRLEIHADTFEDLLGQMRGLLAGSSTVDVSVTAAEVVSLSETARLLNATHDALDPQPVDAEEKLRAAGATPEFAAAQTEGKKRGRKPGSKNTKPAGSHGLPADQPAVSNNTGNSGGGVSTILTESEAAPSASETSAAEASPAPEKTAAVADAGSPPADATADLSFEDFKKRLNDLQGVNGDNLRHITAALNALGYAKVKEVKPEDYAKVLAKCDELTKVQS